MVNGDTRALVVCSELSVRNSVVSGIEPATLRFMLQSLNHTTTGPQCSESIMILSIAVYTKTPI